MSQHRYHRKNYTLTTKTANQVFDTLLKHNCMQEGEYNRRDFTDRQIEDEPHICVEYRLNASLGYKFWNMHGSFYIQTDSEKNETDDALLDVNKELEVIYTEHYREARFRNLKFWRNWSLF
ncbi:MAG: hypothetical protein ACI8QY_001163 [bacterium]|jgi:hypothetical protein